MPTCDIVKELNEVVGLSSPGVHAVAFVIRGDVQFTEEKAASIDLFFRLFGKNVEKFTFVIFTHTESQSELSQFLAGEEATEENFIHPGFKDRILNKVLSPMLFKLLSRCKGNITIIDNTANPEIKEKQVQTVLEEIKRIKQTNFNACFSSPLTESSSGSDSKSGNTGTDTNEGVRDELKSNAQNDDSFLERASYVVNYFVERFKAFKESAKSLSRKIVGFFEKIVLENRLQNL